MTASVTGKTYPLWPKGAPNNNGNPTDTAKVSVFLPDAKKATGRAVVICPGGGYGFLAMEHEGTDWAPFFNREGIAVIVLKYPGVTALESVPRTLGAVPEKPHII